MSQDISRESIAFISQVDYAQRNLWIKELQLAMPEERILAFSDMSTTEREQCRVAIVANPDPAELSTLPRLEWIHSVWAGVERLMADLGDTKLKIVRLVDPQLATTMAEAVLAWTLYLHRQMPLYNQQQKLRLWKAQEYISPEKKTVSILGLGTLGEAAAKCLISAGFKVCGWSRNPKQIENVQCFSGNDGLKDMLAQTNILVCLLPLTPETRYLLDAEKISMLPYGAELINFARGAIVRDADLRTALDSAHLNHAVVDVFETEPLPFNEWHWDHPRVTVLPHCSAPTNRSTASAIVAKNIETYRLSGAIPKHVDTRRGY